MSRRKGKNRTFFDESLDLNNSTYGQYFHRLMELSITMFKWNNLPDTVDERFLELTLFTDGQAVFFKDEDLKNDQLGEDGQYLALQCIINGPLNVYRIPIRRRAFAVSGYQKELDINNSVIIYNNYLHTNSVLDVRMFARRLYNIDRIIDVNVNAQKTPVLLQGSEQQRLTLLNLYKEYDGNQPVIFGDKNLDINSLKSIRTDAPYIGDKLFQLKTQIWNEALTYLGISNVSYQKKERMITDEAIRNQGGTIASRYARLDMRRKACEQINRMFGLDISVEFKEDYRQADDEVMFKGESDSDYELTDKMGSDLAIDLRTE